MTAGTVLKEVRTDSKAGRMGSFLIWGLLVGFLLFSATSLKAQSFFQQLPDLPLMAGLSELTDAGLSFDKPEGRIVEAFAQGPASGGPDAPDVLRFYEQSLPQLGWQAGEDPNTYYREKEKLVLQVEQEQERLLLHLSLSPR
ncbi:hypothetical protein ACTL6U_09945 [Rhodovibrionaceae bacterium A322]